MDPEKLEEAFHEFYQNFSKWLPDGVVSININTLSDLGLLSTKKIEEETTDSLSHKFHVIEVGDRVTLYNEQFVIWILPQNQGETSSTITMIALLQNNKPHLEIVYTNTGIYNTPRYILKVLEHYISEVIDTEAILSSIGKKQ